MKMKFNSPKTAIVHWVSTGYHQSVYKQDFSNVVEVVSGSSCTTLVFPNRTKKIFDIDCSEIEFV